MIVTIFIILVYGFLIYFGIIKTIIERIEYKKELNKYKEKKRKLTEKYEKRRIILIKNNNTLNDYDNSYMWVDERNRLWDIDYPDHKIFYEKKNRPTKI